MTQPTDGATVNPTPENERALSRKAFELAKPTIERWRQMPNRDAYVESTMVSAAYVAYRAGREDAANDSCGCLGYYPRPLPESGASRSA